MFVGYVELQGQVVLISRVLEGERLGLPGGRDGDVASVDEVLYEMSAK